MGTSFSDLILRSTHRFQPIVPSLLDTDFYKLLMLQFIWARYRDVEVEFALTNRTKTIRLADSLSEKDLREQFDHTKSLRFGEGEISWLRGQTFYGQEGLFTPEFLTALRDFKMGDYRLSKNETGEWEFTFSGNWMQASMWEIHSLCIVNELRYRTLLSNTSERDLDRIYHRAYTILDDKLTSLRQAHETIAPLALTDFGTRRRHSFAWQEQAVLLARHVLGSAMTGTSNAYLAMHHGLEAKGTNAHELPMVLAALAPSDEALRHSQYDVLQQWAETYRGALLVMLPDTFGTTQFLDGAAAALGRSVTDWTGARPDSKDPIEGGEELIQYWKDIGANPQEKLIIFSDGLDVTLPYRDPNGSDIATLMRHFNGRVRLGFGFGTNLTNDFRGCYPGDPDRLKPLSLVCKAKSANGRPCVKLSDVYSKATGPAAEIERYRKVFGSLGIKNAPTPKV